jgi:hypothetical protein
MSMQGHCVLRLGPSLIFSIIIADIHSCIFPSKSRRRDVAIYRNQQDGNLFHCYLYFSQAPLEIYF